jgi:MFS family permease
MRYRAANMKQVAIATAGVLGVMAIAATYAVQADLVLPSWLVLTYLLHTMGELCLSPVGLSAITKLSPKRLVGQMMGIWFIAAALGNLMAGLIAGRFDPEALEHMPSLFTMVLMSTAGLGVVFLLFLRPFRQLAHERGPDVVAGDRLFRKLGIEALVVGGAGGGRAGRAPRGAPRGPPGPPRRPAAPRGRSRPSSTSPSPT